MKLLVPAIIMLSLIACDNNRRNAKSMAEIQNNSQEGVQTTPEEASKAKGVQECSSQVEFMTFNLLNNKQLTQETVSELQNLSAQLSQSDFLESSSVLKEYNQKRANYVTYLNGVVQTCSSLSSVVELASEVENTCQIKGKIIESNFILTNCSVEKAVAKIINLDNAYDQLYYQFLQSKNEKTQEEALDKAQETKTETSSDDEIVAIATTTTTSTIIEENYPDNSEVEQEVTEEESDLSADHTASLCREEIETHNASILNLKDIITEKENILDSSYRGIIDNSLSIEERVQSKKHFQIVWEELFGESIHVSQEHTDGFYGIAKLECQKTKSLGFNECLSSDKKIISQPSINQVCSGIMKKIDLLQVNKMQGVIAQTDLREAPEVSISESPEETRPSDQTVKNNDKNEEKTKESKTEKNLKEEKRAENSKSTGKEEIIRSEGKCSTETLSWIQTIVKNKHKLDKIFKSLVKIHTSAIDKKISLQERQEYKKLYSINLEENWLQQHKSAIVVCEDKISDFQECSGVTPKDENNYSFEGSPFTKDYVAGYCDYKNYELSVVNMNKNMEKIEKLAAKKEEQRKNAPLCSTETNEVYETLQKQWEIVQEVYGSLEATYAEFLSVTSENEKLSKFAQFQTMATGTVTIPDSSSEVITRPARAHDKENSFNSMAISLSETCKVLSNASKQATCRPSESSAPIVVKDLEEGVCRFILKDQDCLQTVEEDFGPTVSLKDQPQKLEQKKAAQFKCSKDLSLEVQVMDTEMRQETLNLGVTP